MNIIIGGDAENVHEKVKLRGLGNEDICCMEVNIERYKDTKQRVLARRREGPLGLEIEKGNSFH